MYRQKALMLSVLAPASAFSTFRGVGRIVAFALMVGGSPCWHRDRHAGVLVRLRLWQPKKSRPRILQVMVRRLEDKIDRLTVENTELGY
jgi:hypothetical protein